MTIRSLGSAHSVFLLVSLSASPNAVAQGPDIAIFEQAHIHDVHMTFADDAVTVLKQQVDKNSPRVDVDGSLVIDGTGVDAMVHLRGSVGSFRTFDHKPGFNLKFTSGFQGLKELELHSNVQDDTFLSDSLTYEMFRLAGQPARRVSWAKVYVNGVYYGIYTAEEPIDKIFLSNWFRDPSGNLYKCDVTDGLNPHCDFPDSSGWKKETNKRDPRREELAAAAAVFVDHQDSPGRATALEPLFDLMNFRTLWAIEDLTCQRDGYINAPSNNNYYVYNEPTRGRFSLIPSGADQGFRQIDCSHMSGQGMTRYLAGTSGANPPAEDEVRRELLAGAWRAEDLVTKIEAVQSILLPALNAPENNVDSSLWFTAHSNQMKYFVEERPRAVAAWDCPSTNHFFQDYGAKNFAYQVTSSPPDHWMDREFDDASWRQASGPIGSGRDCDLASVSPWPSTTTAIARFRFVLPDPSALCSLRIGLAVDDVVEEAYLNGKSIMKRPLSLYQCAYADSLVLFPEREAWVAGTNVLAFKVKDMGGSSYFDFSVSAK